MDFGNQVIPKDGSTLTVGPYKMQTAVAFGEILVGSGILVHGPTVGRCWTINSVCCCTGDDGTA
eukprot:7514297-Ditylum_brightwellii.AAC.1